MLTIEQLPYGHKSHKALIIPKLAHFPVSNFMASMKIELYIIGPITVAMH